VRAIRFAGFGDPSVLRVDEITEPGPPRGDQILVRVAASSVNGTDLGLRRGDMKIATVGRMPFTPGFDMAGEVLRCGPAVTAFTPGDQVMALLGHAGGGQAELVLIGQERAARAPATVPPAAAAALPLAGLTALQALYGKAGLQARSRARVLVLGGAGGIGSFGVQLAVLAGTHVTASVSAQRREFVSELGADVVVDRHAVDVTACGERWDVILDAPGRLRLAAAQPILRPGGILVSTRPLGPDALRAAGPARWRGGPGRFAGVMTAARSADLAHLAALVDSGRLRVPLDRVVPMSQASAAHRHAENGVRGKVVISMCG
jgi:NADPH:quinone reductase-like Zn-dependent oxidoreductase